MNPRRFSARTAIVAAFAVLACASPALAQPIQYSISNQFRYGIGEQYEGETPFRKEYLENLLGTRIYAGDLTLGFRISVDKPREYGRDTLGLTEYYAEFQREGLRARAGTFYHLVDRGLIFNTFESRPLGFETRTEGVRLDYEIPEFGANAFGGMLRYPDISSATRLEEYLVRGAQGVVRPLEGLSAGAAYVQASARSGRTSFSKPFDAYLRQAWLRGTYEGLTAHLSLADKRTQLDSSIRATTTSRAYGTGLYSMLSYSGETFGLTAEYKNYRFDLVKPSEIHAGTRATRALPFQYPPTLVPEHDKTLLARNPHQVDPNDEVGFQVEAFVLPMDELTLTLIGTGGSRHNAWRADSTPAGGTLQFTQLNTTPLAFPELADPTYSPYWEAFLGAEYVASDELTFGLGVQRRDNVSYYEGPGNGGPSSSETYKATTLMFESVADVSEDFNLHGIIEVQRVLDTKKATQANDSLGITAYSGQYNNALLTLELSAADGWAVNTRIEYSTTEREQGGRQWWPVVGGTYRIGRAHILGVQYGAERGGVVCTGGVCRFINPFSGFRLYLESKL